MIVPRIAIVVLMLAVVPLGYGILLSGWNKRICPPDCLLVYLFGICVYYALFSCATVPMTIFHRPLHEVKYLGMALNAVSILFLVFYIFKKRGRITGIQWICRIKKTFRKHWWILFPVCIIAFQIFRSVTRMNSVYSDDDTYIPIIVDMLKTDLILGTDPCTGLVNLVSFANPKYVLTAWLQFLAVLSSLSGLHPLLLIKTVLPVFLISWHYLVVWKIIGYMSADAKIRIGILFFYTLLMEFGSPSLNTDLSYYLFTWSWYGKAVLQFFLIPMVILFFLMIQKVKTGWREGMILMFLTAAGLGLSTMGMILLTIMILVFVALECIEKHSVREQWIMVPALFPIIIVTLLYFTMF